MHFKQGQVNKVGVKDNNDHQAFDIMVVVKFKEEVSNETTDDGVGRGWWWAEEIAPTPHSALNMQK